MTLRRRVQVSVTADELETWRHAHARLERTMGMLRAYQRQGLTAVPVEDVLDLLGAGPEVPPPQAQPHNPRVDKLTGALWAGPPGSLPPS